MINKDMFIPGFPEELINAISYSIRGQKVILDYDLSIIYGYKLKDFIKEVENNKKYFDDDFMFKLNQEELEEVKKQNRFSLKNYYRDNDDHYRLPFAFTEMGIQMLILRLKGKFASEQSVLFIDTFVAMKHCFEKGIPMSLKSNQYVDEYLKNIMNYFVETNNK